MTSQNPVESGTNHFCSKPIYDTENGPETLLQQRPALTTNAKDRAMADALFNPISGKSQDSNSASAAWVIHAALARAERDAPSLCDDPRWQSLRREAYERFALEFGAAS